MTIDSKIGAIVYRLGVSYRRSCLRCLRHL
jgi:hypothetical protein